MLPLVYRQDRMFKINDEALPAGARTLEVKQKLFVALFREFRGASENDKYKKMSYQERIEILNQYARDWLTKQGFKNVG